MKSSPDEECKSERYFSSMSNFQSYECLHQIIPFDINDPYDWNAFNNEYFESLPGRRKIFNSMHHLCEEVLPKAKKILGILATTDEIICKLDARRNPVCVVDTMDGSRKHQIFLFSDAEGPEGQEIKIKSISVYELVRAFRRHFLIFGILHNPNVRMINHVVDWTPPMFDGEWFLTEQDYSDPSNAIEGSEPWIDFILHMIAGGNQEEFRQIIHELASIVQRPLDQPKRALVTTKADRRVFQVITMFLELVIGVDNCVVRTSAAPPFDRKLLTFVYDGDEKSQVEHDVNKEINEVHALNQLPRTKFRPAYFWIFTEREGPNMRNLDRDWLEHQYLTPEYASAFFHYLKNTSLVVRDEQESLEAHATCSYRQTVEQFFSEQLDCCKKLWNMELRKLSREDKLELSIDTLTKKLIFWLEEVKPTAIDRKELTKYRMAFRALMKEKGFDCEKRIGSKDPGTRKRYWWPKLPTAPDSRN
jgi:hypothetical protein